MIRAEFAVDGAEALGGWAVCGIDRKPESDNFCRGPQVEMIDAKGNDVSTAGGGEFSGIELIATNGGEDSRNFVGHDGHAHARAAH